MQLLAISLILFNIPFVSQAPTGNWRDVVFKDACEEASVLMAMAWLKGETIDPAQAEIDLHAIAAWEKQRFGFHQDTGAADTAKIFIEYFGYPVTVHYDISSADIMATLENRSIAVVPINARVLYNRKSPPRHMIVVTGFDPVTNEFIIHDPMLKDGAHRVSRSKLDSALRDYPSGVHKVVRNQRTAMIVVGWPWLANP